MAVIGLTVCTWGGSQDTRRKLYVLPAADAAIALHRFSEQADVQVIFIIDEVRGVRTRAVNELCTAREAVERMLVKTELCVIEDHETGALMIRRKAVPPPTADDAT